MADTERGFLGMTHNPFVAPDEGFFEQADRKSHLEQLRHLSQWSRRVLLVTGPHGIGKTTLYRRLSATLEPRCKAARIHASLVNTSREVLVSVAQGFGVATPADANTQLLTRLVKNHVDEQVAAERICLVMVDDADLLEPKAVVELMTLARECTLQLVLFGDMKLAPAIERTAGRLELGWHEIRLQGFNEQQTRAYLEWRFQQARYRGRLPFTESQVKEIQRLSDGIPGKINQMANVLLVKLESGDIGKGSAAFPAVHKALLILLTVVVGLLYLLWQQNEEFRQREALLAESAAEMSATEVESLHPIAQQPGSAIVETAEQAIIAAEAEAEAEAQSEAPVSAAETTAESVTEVAKAQGAVTREASVNTALEKPDQPATLAVAERATPAAVARPPVPQPERIAPVAKPAAADVKPAAVEKATPAKPAAPVTQAAGYHDSQWLLAQSPERFTLQLVTVSSAERARVFIAAQPDPQQFAVYQLRRDGRVLHVVVYGLYDSRADADAASRKLPASVGKVNPWIRTLGQVHGAIATMQ